jgi:signal transduction histidine kinase
MVASQPFALLGTIPAALVSFGFFGLVWQPLWWASWAVPIGLATGAWVTPWYFWYAVTYVVPSLAAVPGWLSPVVGLIVAFVGLLLALPMLRVRTWWDRLLLNPTQANLLAQRVLRLTETRSDAVDVQAAELRRIERDLHDGAQARLVAVGLSLATIERLMEQDPAAARALLAQARESSATALTELRDLVRGIHPPVLAERGLADAVRAVALDSPIPVSVTVDLAGRPAPPVESAAYFAVNELLANAIRHADARRIDIDICHRDGMLTIGVTDDGGGGADPARGSGLDGIRRRLGTFDGVLVLRSRRGGPTVATLEIPCALSSPRTSTS